MDPALLAKKLEYEDRKARAKEARARLVCTICGKKAKLPCPCGTTQYCSTECQRIDWRDRGHRKACKTIRNERAAEAARAEAPAPPARDVFYGPAPRSHADEVRARIAAEHEAARARREANPDPDPEPWSVRCGSRCPICLEDWDVNFGPDLLICCCRNICRSCHQKTARTPCPFCRTQPAKSNAEVLVRLRRHVENEVPQAITKLGQAYRDGSYGLAKNLRKSAKIFKRAVELGDADAMVNLAMMYWQGGEGVKEDVNKAKQLFMSGSDRGYVPAQAMLGMIMVGEIEAGIHEDREGTFSILYSAADRGHSGSQTQLAQCYLHGIAVEADPDEAKRWYARVVAESLSPRFRENAKAALARLAQSDP